MGSHTQQHLMDDRDALTARFGREERFQKSLEAKTARVRRVRAEAST